MGKACPVEVCGLSKGGKAVECRVVRCSVDIEKKTKGGGGGSVGEMFGCLC